MPNRSRYTVTVSPPTFDRTAFARTDAALPAPHAPYDRAWLMARFAEGLQIRILKPPHEGLVMFQPGRLSWRPIEAVERAVVIHDLRAGEGALRRESVALLWSEVESFARYYGYSAVIALLGDGPGLISRSHAPGRGWITLDTGPGEVRLVGRVLQGPLALPHLPRDWTIRAAATGPGVTIQTTGESAPLERRAERICAALGGSGVAARHERLPDADRARSCAIDPAGAYAVSVEGRHVGGAAVTTGDILGHLAAAGGTGQSPS